MLENPYTKTIHSLEDLIPLSDWVRPSITILKGNMKSDSAHDEVHILRVVRNALWFADNEGKYDKDVLIPSCLLHDLVNLPKDHPERKHASKMSADLAWDQFRKLGWDQLDPGMYHAIQAHSYSANIIPKTIEAKSLQDADRIDALGYIGIARMFSVSGSLGRELFHPTDPLCLNGRELDESKYAVDHFFTKLEKLPDTMQTRLGHVVASIKVNQMREFIVNLNMENKGDLLISR